MNEQEKISKLQCLPKKMLNNISKERIEKTTGGISFTSG